VRHSTSAWLRLPALPVLIVAVVGCTLSLRGAANPGGTFGTPTPLTAGGPPRVEIASPATGSSGSVGHSIDVDVRGSDPYPFGVGRLELFIDDKLVDRVVVGGGAARQDFAAILSWVPLGPGTYTLSAYAYRLDGAVSDPAEVIVIVTGQAIASETPSPEPTLTPTPSPSGSQIPTVTLSPSPKPTPTPTPVPIGIHVEVWVEPAEMPAWTVGERGTLVVHVQNQGGYPVPYIRVSASLAGSADRGRTGALAPGQSTTLKLSLTPQSAGDAKRLLVEGRIPQGYFDLLPGLNSLVWQMQVVVSGGATPEPTPTGSPG
jgi:Big-like domain-containing protein